MKAEELRINNWIYYKGEPIKVTMVGQYGIQSKSDVQIINTKFSTPDLQPIPLTPEILEKCEFVEVKLKTFTYWRCYHFELSFHRKMYYLKGTKFYMHGIKYLHQLQNLYYALTESELPTPPGQLADPTADGI